MINISRPIIDKETIEAVVTVLQSGEIRQGKKTVLLEERLSKINKVKYTVVVNSGTAALHTALVAIGVKPGDEVITSAFSFVSTANTILMCRAVPVFSDIVEDSFTLNPKLIEEKITQRTKAILPVDLYGQPCDYEQIGKIAKKHNLYVISDACQAIGADYKKKKIAELVDIACFSFYATKNITMGEGGALLTDRKDIYKFARTFRHNGQDPEKQYHYLGLGYNYRSTDITSTIALYQLRHLIQWTKKRQRNARLLTKGLANIKGIIVPKMDSGKTHVFHQFTIRVTNDFPFTRDQLQKTLLKEGIITGIYYPSILPIHKHVRKVTGYKKGDFPIAERISKEVLSLPVHPGVTETDITKIIHVIRRMH